MSQSLDEKSVGHVAINVMRTLTFGSSTLQIHGTPDVPWFNGREIASILGYSNYWDAIKRHVDEEDKFDLETLISKVLVFHEDPEKLNKNDLSAIYITESGLYSLILKSKLKSAKDFKRWVTSEVLPSIRKTGSFQVNAQVQMLTSELTNQRLLTDQSLQIAEEARKKAVNNEDAFRAANEKHEAEQKAKDDELASSFAQLKIKDETISQTKDEADKLREEKVAQDAELVRLKKETDDKQTEIDGLKLSSDNAKAAHIANRQKRDQAVYILTNDYYKAQDTYKVGRTKNHTASRVSTLNSAHLESDPLRVLYEFNCHSALVLETVIHDALYPFRLGDGREFFCIPLKDLHERCSTIADANKKSDEGTIEMINRIMGAPYPGGRDADLRLEEIKEGKIAEIIPSSLTNLSNADAKLLREFARKAVFNWKSGQNPQPQGLDWLKFQIGLKLGLKGAQYQLNTKYKAKEWKKITEEVWNEQVHSHNHDHDQE